MAYPPRRILPLIFACLFLCAGVSFLAQTAGGNRGTPGRPPTGGPELGLPGSKQPTTRPGSHESAVKDERDRIAGKFPAPKEKNDTEEARRNAAASAGTVYVDAIALEGPRQALTLTRDDFRVTIDGGPRRIVSVHYVFRGPQAPGAARALAVGSGVVAHADEARTIAILVDEASFGAGAQASMRSRVEHLLDVVAPVDRVALLTLPHPGALKFAGTREDLVADLERIVGRGSGAAAPPDASFTSLARVLTDLLKVPGPKSAILFSGAPPRAAHVVAAGADAQTLRVSAILNAAAASRTTIDLVTISHPAGGTSEFSTLARATGGTTVRLTGEPDDLAPLAVMLLGGYIIEVEAHASDRDGTAHALTVTSVTKGVRVLAPSRWMPRVDPLPAPAAKGKP